MVEILARSGGLNGVGAEEFSPILNAMDDQARTLHDAATVDDASEPMIRLAATIARLTPGKLN